MAILQRSAAALLVMVQLVSGGAKPTPAWKAELPRKLDAIRFSADSRHVLIGSGSATWLYDAATGAKIWEKEFEEKDNKGIRLVPQGDKFLISTRKNTIECLSIATGTKLWETEVEGVDQDDYSKVDSVAADIARIQYRDWRVQVDLSTGKVLWSGRINTKLKENNGYVVVDLPKIQKSILLMDNDQFAICDNTGAAKPVALEYPPPYKLVAKGEEWIYESPDDRMVVVAFDGGMAVVDALNGREVFRHPMEIDVDHRVLFPTRSGCAVFGHDRMVHYEFASGKSVELPVEFVRLRTLEQYTIGGKDLLLLSLEDQLVCVDLVNGKELWRSKEGDPAFAGFVHCYRSSDGKLLVDGSRIVVTYVQSQRSGENSGTHLYAMGIDALTGSVGFRTRVALAEKSLSSGGGLFSIIGKIYTAALTFGLSVASDMLSPDLGYGNIGFDYSLMLDRGVLYTIVITTAEMLNPDTRAEHGEGICAVDIRSGKKIYGEHFPIAEAIKPEWMPLKVDFEDNSILYIPGHKKIVAFNLQAGKRVWTIEGPLDGQPADLALLNGTLYAKLGNSHYSSSYTAARKGFWDFAGGKAQNKNLEVNKNWSADPFGFAAIDPASGKLLWRIETDNDPALAAAYFAAGENGELMKQFRFKDYYDPARNQLYYSDLKNVYALTLGPGGGKLAWTCSLSKNDVGRINFEKAFAGTKLAKEKNCVTGL